MQFMVYFSSMQHMTLLCIGAIKTPWIAEGCMDYLGRLARSLRLEVVELPASRQKDASKQVAEESDRLLEALEKREGDVWVLDERGERKTSVQLSAVLSQARDAGRSLLFVLGGAYGLDERVRARAQHVLRLSDMTFPHELCRVLFFEQLYRAEQIASGSQYHH